MQHHPDGTTEPSLHYSHQGWILLQPDDQVLSAINAGLELRRYTRSITESDAADLRTLVGP